MDIKLINNKKLINIITAIILVIMSIGIYSSYGEIYRKAKEKQEEINFFSDKGFVNNIASFNYVLYHKLYERNEGKRLDKSESFIKMNEGKYINQQTGETISKEEVLERFDETYNQWQRNLDIEYKNMEYYAVNKDLNINITNSDNDLKLLFNESQSIKDQYRFYIVINYDKLGNMEISELYSSSDIDEYRFNGNMADSETTIREENYENSNLYTIQQPQNSTFIYAIPKELKYKDSIYENIESREYWEYASVINNKINKFIRIVALIVLFIPLIISKSIFGISKFKKLPVEINGYITWLILFGQWYFIYDIITKTINGTLMGGSKILALIVNIVFWCIVLYIAILETVIIKDFVTTNPKENIKKKSIIYKAIIYIKIKWNEFYRTLENIDLREQHNKKLKRLVIINGIVVSVICCGWFFGIIAVIIYSLIIFRIAYKYVGGIRDKYKKLLESTNKIAEGNLDVEIDEELGVFNPFKDELKKIQKGFKVAVDEEVKSQKMKTELISNVSHDLKTPLTSIITYIDLLKDDKISDVDRRKYIDTIDRKSQRLKVLIEDLFEVSKATSGNIKLNKMDVDVVALIKQTEFELEDKIKEAELTVKFNIEKEKIIRSLDSERTFRVFENLLLNTTKYAMKGSRVYIDLKELNGNAEIIIKNISAMEIDFSGDQIVERFSRGDKARNTEGSGLGLAIAKSFVELQGGTFKVEVDGDLFKVRILL